MDFNGLGTLNYCATVERTGEIGRLLQNDVLERTRKFIASLPREMMDRALTRAYIHETQDSFAIEKEAPTEDKAPRFIQLLRQAHEKTPLGETYLADLQSGVVSNSFDRAVAFGSEQNHLRSGMRGVAGVSYVPPPPDLCRELMNELVQFSNNQAPGVAPLVIASVVSFGFVFLPPFMDGNGRLSGGSEKFLPGLDQRGKVSNNRRKQYANRVPAELFDSLEKLAGRLLASKR